MHLSRLHQAIFFAERTLRPGDGERWIDSNHQPNFLCKKNLEERRY